MLNNFSNLKTPDLQDNMDSKYPRIPEKGREEPSMEEIFLIRLKEAIDKNLETPDFGMDELGKEIGMSRSQIHRKLQ